MDIDKLIEANQRFDKEFQRTHPQFVQWWANHPHCDKDPKFAVAPRVAWKCECYQQEYLEAKEIGIA